MKGEREIQDREINDAQQILPKAKLCLGDQDQGEPCRIWRERKRMKRNNREDHGGGGKSSCRRRPLIELTATPKNNVCLKCCVSGRMQLGNA